METYKELAEMWTYFSIVFGTAAVIMFTLTVIGAYGLYWLLSDNN